MFLLSFAKKKIKAVKKEKTNAVKNDENIRVQ